MESSHFEKTLKKIEEAYDVSLKKLGSFCEKVDVIPSGSYILDDALGVGGYPRGRLIEIYGEFSSGKCISSDSYIFSKDGLLTLKEFAPKLKEKEVKIFIKDILTSRGVRKTSHIYNDGIKKVIKVTTSSGFELSGSEENTKILVLTSNGLIWKEMKYLEIGEYVALRIGDNVFGNTLAVRSFSSKSLAKLYEWGKNFDVTQDFPLKIRKAPKEHVISFLSGLIDAHSSLYEYSLLIQLPSHLTKVIQLFLLNLGIVSYRKNLISNRGSVLFVTGKNLERFREIFVNSNISSHLKEIPDLDKRRELVPLSNSIVNTFFEEINVSTRINHPLTKSELAKIVSDYKKYFKLPIFKTLAALANPNWMFDHITKLEEETSEVYDFEVPFFQDFVANGIIVHNTLLGLLGIASTQKRGGKALFIDAEYTLDLKWAKVLGVDVDNLYVLQENCFEKVMNVIEKVVDDSLFDLIVVDSVTALVPQKELEGEMEDQNIALQARLMSQALRKLVGKVSKSKTVVLFINQLRDNVGVLFGNPSVTPGGRALKFYSTIRLNVGKESGSDLKENGVKIGHRLKFKVEKNKVAAPFKEGSTLLLYQKGIDEVREILELSIKRKIIEMKGNTYVFGDKKWIGFDNLYEYSLTDPQLIEQLKEKLNLK